MAEPSLPDLEAERDRLYAQLSTVGDFRRGSVSENYRKCGKPNCACAAPDHPGHGPRFLWTRSQGRRKRAGRQLAVGEVERCAARSRGTPSSPRCGADLLAAQGRSGIDTSWLRQELGLPTKWPAEFLNDALHTLEQSIIR